MNLLKKTIEKLLEEVDEDIKETMLTKEFDNESTYKESYYAWELTSSPILTIIEWQRMRNEKKKGSEIK